MQEKKDNFKTIEIFQNINAPYVSYKELIEILKKCPESLKGIMATEKDGAFVFRLFLTLPDRAILGEQIKKGKNKGWR